MDKVFKDVSSGFVATVELNPVHVEAAKLPVRKYGYVRRMRTLDALQLAIAVDLRQSGELDTFVVAGKLLAEIAVL